MELLPLKSFSSLALGNKGSIPDTNYRTVSYEENVPVTSGFYSWLTQSEGAPQCHSPDRPGSCELDKEGQGEAREEQWARLCCTPGGLKAHVLTHSWPSLPVSLHLSSHSLGARINGTYTWL